MSRKVVLVEFSECEHSTDLDTYASDLVSSGATIHLKRVFPECETGQIRFEVDDFPSFLSKFEKTESFLFSSLNQ